MDGLIGYVLAKGYVDKTMAGMGAVAGAACQIDSITPVIGGHQIVFKWKDNTGVTHTSAPMFVADGESAYDIWLAQGNTGTVTDFLDSFKGDSAYQEWLNAGNTGTVTDFLDSFKGKSAYQEWLDQGNTGTEADFLSSLKGITSLKPGSGITITTDPVTGEVTIDSVGGGSGGGSGVAGDSDFDILW